MEVVIGYGDRGDAGAIGRQRPDERGGVLRLEHAKHQMQPLSFEMLRQRGPRARVVSPVEPDLVFLRQRSVGQPLEPRGPVRAAQSCLQGFFADRDQALMAQQGDRQRRILCLMRADHRRDGQVQFALRVRIVQHVSQRVG